MNLTKNFTLLELINTNYLSVREQNLEYSKHPAIQRNLKNLCELVLQPARDLLQVPLVISSGFRCPELNERVGSKDTSQHLVGEAADFIPKGIELMQAWEMIKTSNIQYGQLILEPSWIHISLPSPYKSFRQSLILSK